MTTNSRSITRLSAFALGALLVGSPATAAFAAEPTSAPEAQALAQHYREQAAQYRALGAVGFKAGLVQRAEGTAAKYAALAEELAAPTVAMPARSPEADRYGELARQYRALGAAAYKSGLVQWAEAQERKYEAVPVVAAPPAPAAGLACGAAEKPVARLLACAD
jgi:hypothetical protein